MCSSRSFASIIYVKGGGRHYMDNVVCQFEIVILL
jgi:hypothetical protein